MALDWDNIIIETDEYSYSLDAEQRMILFAGNKGDPGDPGEAATITVGTVTTLAAGSPATVENVGTPQAARFNFGIPQGPQGDPGSSGGGAWGEITGTLSDQTDLQDALDAKADSADLGDLAEKDQAAWSTDISGIPSTFPPETHNHDDRYYTESEVNTRLAGKLFIYSSDTLSYWDDTPTADSTKPVTSRGIKTALDSKANNSILGDAFSTSAAYAIGDYCIYEGALYRFTSAHSAGAWNSSHVTQVVAMNELAALSAQVASRMDFKITGTVSASNYTLTDSRINDNHWEVLSIYFETPGNVTTQIHWTTDITNHTVSLSATYAGSTNVVVKMHWVQ